MEFDCGQQGNSRFHVHVHDRISLYNRLWLNLPGKKDEYLYGGNNHVTWDRDGIAHQFPYSFLLGGEQYSHFNLKGRAFPMWCREQGVGRSANVVGYLAGSRNNTKPGHPKRCIRHVFFTELVAGAGGDYHTTYWPQSTFVSSQLYYLHVDHDNYNVLNFT